MCENWDKQTELCEPWETHDQVGTITVECDEFVIIKQEEDK